MRIIISYSEISYSLVLELLDIISLPFNIFFLFLELLVYILWDFLYLHLFGIYHAFFFLSCVASDLLIPIFKFVIVPKLLYLFPSI